MRHARMFAAIIVLLLPFGVTGALAERPCPGGTCKCAGTPDCKKLDMSGQCNGPITCGSPGEPCSCVSKFKATTNTLQKKPVSKSQQ